MAPLLIGSGPEMARRYWGWNEVPVSKDLINDDTNTCAYMIKLPANICRGPHEHDEIKCLGRGEQGQLEQDLTALVSHGHIVPGRDKMTKRPGSYMVVVREFDTGNGIYERQFFCQNWVSPSWKFKLVFEPMKIQDSTNSMVTPGVCFLEQIHQTIAV